MLRALVLALVLANLVYLVWVQGLLAPYGFAPARQAEPERLEQQIRPDAVELLPAPPVQPGASAPASAPTPGAAASAPTPAPVAPASATASAPSAPVSEPSAPASAPAAPGAAASIPTASAAAPRSTASTASRPVASAASKPGEPRPATDAAVVPVAARKSESEARKSDSDSRKNDADTRKNEPEESSQCLQAGLFTEAQASAMRPRLQASLPAGSWTFASSTTKPVRWIVYMGKYVNKEALNKKRALLQQADVPFEAPDSPQLNPGLSLGSYKTKAQAEAALAKLTERGIRSAKVVQERPELPNQWLKLPSASPALQTKAKSLVPQISGKPLKACS